MYKCVRVFAMIAEHLHTPYVRCNKQKTPANLTAGWSVYVLILLVEIKKLKGQGGDKLIYTLCDFVDSNDLKLR